MTDKHQENKEDMQYSGFCFLDNIHKHITCQTLQGYSYQCFNLHHCLWCFGYIRTKRQKTESNDQIVKRHYIIRDKGEK